MEKQISWTSAAIPDLLGKVVIVTGANSGIGFEAAKVLGEKNADVIFGCQDPIKAKQAIAKLNLKIKNKFHFIAPLNLADISSVKKFAETFQKKYSRLDILINNAGVMSPPYAKTVQGFELQFGVNHLGHFALCGYLLKSLAGTDGSRIVTVSSMAANNGILDLNNLNSEKHYNKNIAYKQSKLANLYFHVELNRYLKHNEISSSSVAAHPGYTRSNLQRHTVGILRKLHVLYTKYRFAQNTKMGTLPILRAATEKELTGNDYFGPDSVDELKGYPVRIELPESIQNIEIAKRLWQRSEELTGVYYNSMIK